MWVVNVYRISFDDKEVPTTELAGTVAFSTREGALVYLENLDIVDFIKIHSNTSIECYGDLYKTTITFVEGLGN